MGNTKDLTCYSERSEGDDFQVIVEVSPLFGEISSDISSTRNDFDERLSSIDEREKVIEEKISRLNDEIDRLTNHADGIDYSIAAAAGILCGFIDSFFVGQFDIEELLNKARSSDAGEKKINGFVETLSERTRLKERVESGLKSKIEKERAKGHELSRQEIEDLRKRITEGVNNAYKKVKEYDAKNNTHSSLTRAISKLEEHFKLPLDKAFEGVDGLNAARHHLDDFAHHPTPLGMVAALMGSFLRIAVFVDKDGCWHIRFVKQKPEEWIKVIAPLVISGVLTWILFCAQRKHEEILDSKLPKPIQNLIFLVAQTPAAIAVLNVINNWLGHLASDMAGSRSSSINDKPGMGIAGFFLSSLKELSSIPPLNKTPLPGIVNDLYEKERLDLRKELNVVGDIGKFLGKQTLPVVLGEIVVRSFYFVRHLVIDLRSGKTLNQVDWKNAIPFNNRTIARMITIESSVFSAFDIADAAIRSTVKNGTPENPLFWKDLFFSINIVGVGRCVIAVGNDVRMGLKKTSLIKERMAFKNRALQLQNAKMFVCVGGAWEAASNTSESLKSLMHTAKESVAFYNDTINRMTDKLPNAISVLVDIKNADPDFFDNSTNIF